MIDKQLLISWLDDEVLVNKYLERFSHEMPLLIQQMYHASQSQQWGEMSLLAHSYKSQMQYIHDEEAASVAYLLETKCSTIPEDPAEVKTSISYLELRLHKTLEEIKIMTG